MEFTELPPAFSAVMSITDCPAPAQGHTTPLSRASITFTATRVYQAEDSRPGEFSFVIRSRTFQWSSRVSPTSLD